MGKWEQTGAAFLKESIKAAGALAIHSNQRQVGETWDSWLIFYIQQSPHFPN